MTTSAAIRAHIVRNFRRDLVGPGPEDSDLARERLAENPSRWYLTGFLAPADDEPEADDPAVQEEMDLDGDDETTGQGAGGVAGDDDEPETPPVRRRFLPSSLGITVLVPPTVSDIEAVLSWGDYVTEPPLPALFLLRDGGGDDGAVRPSPPPRVDWVRLPQERRVHLPIPESGVRRMLVPDSAAPMAAGGGLELAIHARLFTYTLPTGATEQVRAVTVFLVNRRVGRVTRMFADLAYAFQARIELACPSGFRPRYDLSGYWAEDEDLRLADLHYRDVEEYAVGRNCAAGWAVDGDGCVRRAHTDPVPLAEVDRVAPNEDISAVQFGMEALADLAAAGADGLAAALDSLPALYEAWIEGQRQLAIGLDAPRRRETAKTLLAGMGRARERIAAGIALVRDDERARRAFRLMNLAVARAARRRNAGANGDPAAQTPPRWRPFQLAFILLTLEGLARKTHADREIVDLLFFPTGGGKTEAYLGLAAFAIAHRRLSAGGVLGAGVTVIMRYTLRLLTLDQLSRAAGVVCALELMRTDPANRDANGQPMLGDWPIEIGLWVGSDASPNRLGGKGDTGDETAVTRVRRFRKNGPAPAPIKACPWCGTPFERESFTCVPNMTAPRNLEIRCANPACDFTGDRPLPLLTVDEPIYRRLPAFLIATVDKFAGLPWVGESGAFFGHVGRYQDGVGFFGPMDDTQGRPLFNGHTLDPPDLIIQDELHLISGPLGTVAGLYEMAIDRLATRSVGGGHVVRPKIVASTATVRRATSQIRALFARDHTEVFPPPGIARTDSFFARTVRDDANPPRWYIGMAAQGRGPKLVFLRSLTTLVAAAQAAFAAGGVASNGPNPADPYMTALCYFNALRELGGARRIVEDEVRDRAGRYGSRRRRMTPTEAPFANRTIGEPLELTSRVSTDEVAEAKRRLEGAFGVDAGTVDVALATNMISVGLDITRLGLMLVQGQPKTAAEYIQATSRVGRDPGRPGLIVAVLNVHRPRDRMHYEQFGQFHRTFYRAVEATSVTPWAARALDRALAAVVVTMARHIDPSLTPEQAASRLREHPVLRQTVRDAIVSRAIDDAVAGGKPALAQAVDALMDDWMAVADDVSGLTYTRAGGPRHLLYPPLHPALPNLSAAHRQFVAGRSMRDVEPSVRLKVRDPDGNVIANADDLV